MFRRLVSRATMVALVGVVACTCAATATASAATAPHWYVNALPFTTGQNKPITLMGELTLQSNAVGEVFCRNVMEGTVVNEAVTEGTRPRGQLEGWGTNACRAPRLEEYFERILGQHVTVFATAELPIDKELTEAEVCNLEAYEEGAQTLESCPSRSEREVRTLVDFNGLHRRPPSFPWKMEAVASEHESVVEYVDKIGIAPTAHTCYPREEITIYAGTNAQTEVEGPSPWQKVPAGCIKLDLIAPQIPDEVVFYGSLEPKVIDGTKNGLFPSRLQFVTNSGQLVSGEANVTVPETTTFGELKFFATEGLELVTLH